MSRIPLPTDDELDAATRAFLATLPPLNIARMLARTGIAPALYTGVRAVFDDDWFPAEDREIMLFRICRANGSEYEIHQHWAYGGLPDPLVEAILKNDVPALSPWQQELCAMCDVICHAAKLSEAEVAKLVAHYGGHDMACRAILIMSWFNMLSRFVDSTGVPVEEGPDPYAGIAGPTAREG